MNPWHSSWAWRLVGALALAGLPLTTAYAHGDESHGEPEVRAVLDALPPALSDLRVQLRHTLTAQLLVANPTDTPLVVEDSAGRAFLRIGAGRVEADLGASAFHRSNTLMAPGAIEAGASGAPDWEVVEANPNWGWFDLRLRSDDIAVAHDVVDAGKRQTVDQWSIPVRLGDQPSAIQGHFEYVPPAQGMIEARVTDTGALAGQAVVRAMTGSARPGLFLSYRGHHRLIVHGVHNEPLLRFDASGVAVNRHSPTWQNIVPAGAPGYRPGSGVRWTAVSSQKSYGWIDPRAGFSGTVAAADKPSVIKRWAVPVTIGDSESTIEGVTEWQPIEPIASAH